MGSGLTSACDCSNVFRFARLNPNDDSGFPIGHGLSRNSRLIIEAVDKNRETEPQRLNPTLTHLVTAEAANREALRSEKWLKAAINLDINRLLIVYPSYSEDQEVYKKYWPDRIAKKAAFHESRKTDDVMSPELKYMIRKYSISILNVNPRNGLGLKRCSTFTWEEALQESFRFEGEGAQRDYLQCDPGYGFQRESPSFIQKMPNFFQFRKHF